MPLRGLENLENEPKIAELVSHRGKTVLFGAPQTAVVLGKKGNSDCNLPCAWNPACLNEFPSPKTTVDTEWVLNTLCGGKKWGEEGRKEEQWNTMSFQHRHFTWNYKMPKQLSDHLKILLIQYFTELATPCTI